MKVLYFAWLRERVGKAEETIDPPALKYINRLSDFLFVAARSVNDGGRTDILWIPGKNR